MHTIKFDGPQTISNVDEAFARIKAVQGLSQPFELDLTDVTEADLSFAQLLVSAKKTATAAGIAFACALPPDHPVAGVLARAGLGSAGLMDGEAGDLP